MANAISIQFLQKEGHGSLIRNIPDDLPSLEQDWSKRNWSKEQGTIKCNLRRSVWNSFVKETNLNSEKHTKNDEVTLRIEVLKEKKSKLFNLF